MIWLLAAIIDLIRKNYVGWCAKYDNNSLYTLIDFIFTDIKYLSLYNFFMFLIILITHKCIIIIQIILISDLFMIYTIRYFFGYKKKIKACEFNLFLSLNNSIAYILWYKIIYLKKFTAKEIKLIFLNLYWILLIGTSRWIINNCIFILHYINNNIKFINVKKWWNLQTFLVNMFKTEFTKPIVVAEMINKRFSTHI